MTAREQKADAQLVVKKCLCWPLASTDDGRDELPDTISAMVQAWTCQKQEMGIERTPP